MKAGTELTLSARPPFSLSAVVKSHGWVSLAPFAEDKRSGGLSYVGQLASGRVVETLIQEKADGVGVEVDEAYLDVAVRRFKRHANLLSSHHTIQVSK